MSQSSIPSRSSDTTSDGADPNDTAIVLLASYRGLDTLLPADAESGVTLGLSLRRIDVQSHKLGRLVDLLLDVACLERRTLQLVQQPIDLGTWIEDVFATHPHIDAPRRPCSRLERFPNVRPRIFF